MMSKLKSAAPYLGCIAAGTLAGLALATTVAGAKIVARIAHLRGGV